MIPNNYKIIMEGIVGSQAYGLATPNSDIDKKFVYIQPDEDILSNRYVPQINVNADYVGYELRRFLELVSVGNPNVLELLYLPERCILTKTEEWNKILSVREEFLSKKCLSTYAGYSRSQLRKATGLNKKFNYEKHKTERKDVLDWCKIVDRETGLVHPIKEWLKINDYKQEQIGLVSLDGFRDTYKLYTDDIAWADNSMAAKNIDVNNHRGYKGIADKTSNEPRVSEIEKYRINDWKGVMYWNREQYSISCREYKEYKKWLKNRNEDRVATNKKHGQQYDSKNLQNLVRLIMTAKEIPTEGKINVDRTKNRDYLMAIRNGEVDLKILIKEWSEEADKLEELYSNSDLPEEVDKDFTKDLELKIRQGVNTLEEVCQKFLDFQEELKNSKL